VRDTYIKTWLGMGISRPSRDLELNNKELAHLECALNLAGVEGRPARQRTEKFIQ